LQILISQQLTLTLTILQMENNEEDENEDIERKIVESNFCNINFVDKTNFKATLQLFIANYKDNTKTIDLNNYKNWDIPSYFKERINKGDVSSSFLENLNNYTIDNQQKDSQQDIQKS